MRELIGSLPSWARSPFALTIPLLLVVVPVVVSLLRAPHFDTTLEVFPTRPPGNAAATGDYGPAVRGLVANPDFEVGAQGWKGRRTCALRRSREQAHSGAASLACMTNRRRSLGGRAASTRVVLPAAGRYRVQAWVRLPRGYTGGRPQIELEGFSNSRRVATRRGDPGALERWQWISSDYVVETHDVKGRIVLHDDPPLPQRGKALYWDDVGVLPAKDASTPAPRRVNLVSNPGFEYDKSGWGDPPTFTAQRSEIVAHSGSASLRSFNGRRRRSDTNAAYTYLTFPKSARYRAAAWVYLPRNRSVRSGRPAIFLEAFSGSTQLTQQLGDPTRRGTWQRISTDYAISSQDLRGSFVLRDVPGLIRGSRGARRARADTLYLDDVNVLAPRPEASRDALGAAADLRAALQEPQLRFEVSRLARDTKIYDPARASIVRSRRKGTLSFIVRVASDVPKEARSLAGPLRSALVRAATRSTLRRAQTSVQQLISSVGRNLQPDRRALLQRRANVLQGLIGAQAADVVTLPASASASAPAPSAAARRAQLRAQRTRQKIVSKLGNDLPPRQRALVQRRADDLQRMVGAQSLEFVVVPRGPVPRPTRRVDRLLEELPGPFPARAGPAWAGAAGLLCALLLLGTLIVTSAVRHRAAAQGR